jgi:hypothetical protein
MKLYQVKKLVRANIINLNMIVLQRIFPIDSVINVIGNTWKSPSIIDNVGAHFVINKDEVSYQVVSWKYMLIM